MTGSQGESAHAHHWQLNPEIDFLNHGSFGAAPTCVLAHQRHLQDQLEADPIQFLGFERDLVPKLDAVRKVIGQLVNANTSDLVFVRNSTEGVNAVLRSFPFQLGDEVVVTSHGYNACNNAAEYAAQQSGAIVRVAQLPFPIQSHDEVIGAIDAVLTSRTRLLLVDHVTSASALVLPIAEIVALAHQRGIRVLVDGAHAPGMIPVDLQSIGADYYTANHHKWLCSPKTSAFLFVNSEWQTEVLPTIISHGFNRPRPGKSKFLSMFDWMGTYDPTPILSVPTAINFLATLGGGSGTNLAAHINAIHEMSLAARDILLNALDIDPPTPAEMIGTMVTLPLPSTIPSPPADDVDPLQRKLFDDHRIEIPIFHEPGIEVRCLRFSVQAYNHLEQYQRLADVLKQELRI